MPTILSGLKYLTEDILGKTPQSPEEIADACRVTVMERRDGTLIYTTPEKPLKTTGTNEMLFKTE